MEGQRKGRERERKVASWYDILIKRKAYVRKMRIFFTVLLSRSWFI